MTQLFGNSFVPIFALVAFVAVTLFVASLFMVWDSYKGPDAKRIGQRLLALSASSHTSSASSVLRDRLLSELPVMERFMLRFPRLTELDRFIVQSGLQWKVGALLLASAALAVAAFAALSWIPVSLMPKLGLSLLAGLLPLGFVQWRRGIRLGMIELQLPETLDLICRSLRSGQALPASLKLAGEELADPIANEFRITHDEINFGVAVERALDNLSDRVPSTDMRYFVVAVNIQREAGGNLTEVLGNLSKLIRNRLKFQGKIRVLTTEGRMSAWVLGLLPFFLAGMLYFANREFIEVLWTDPTGIKISTVVLTVMAVGAFWLYKIIKIRL